MTAIDDRTTITADVAANLEAEFLGGLEDAQFAYERIVETEAWKLLGFDSFADWWAQRVQPTMRALSMRPTRDIAASVVDRVREEEAELPPAQRRTQRELAEMVGVHPDTISGRKRQDPDKAEVPPDPDLEQPETVETAEDDEPPLPGMPAGQDVADIITAGVDKFLSEQPATKSQPVDQAQSADALERFKREREERQSKEVFSKNLVESIWYLAEFGGVDNAVERSIEKWQPGQDYLPFKTTAARMRKAADYLIALAERWPQ